MSIAGMRTRFKTALDTVDGVQGFEYRPNSVTVGDAWPIRGEAERDDDSGLFLVEWAVQICLASDEQAADVWIDDHVEAVISALRPVAYVDGFSPIKLASSEYAIQLSMRSE